MTLQDLPALNAALNATSTCFLITGYVLIRKGHKTAHRNLMIAALVTSALFLTSYLVYHYQVGHTKFLKPEWARPYYLLLLFTHLVLAIAIVPMIIATVIFAAKQRWEKHKKLARWTWPAWLYVSATGVLIYFLLYHIWPQR